MPKVTGHEIKTISPHGGDKRHCVIVKLDQPLYKLRNGGKSSSTMVQGCFGDRSAAEKRAKSFPKGKIVTPKKRK